MSYPPPRYSIILAILLVPTILYADEPPANSIPIIAMKTGQDATCEDVTLEFLCELSWNYFDGISLEGWETWGTMQTIFEWCDSTGAYIVYAPARYQTLGHLVGEDSWARFDSVALLSDSAFFHTNAVGDSIESFQSAAVMMDEIVKRCSTLADNMEDYDCVWYYAVYDEAPSWQLRRMLNHETTAPYDDYFPNVFTQDTSMCTVAPDGIFSWLMWKSDSIDSDHSIAIDFGSLHTITGWAGKDTDPLGTSHTHATAVRAYMNTMYQALSDSTPLPAPQSNPPELIEYNAYPFRMVGTYYQDTAEVTAVLGDSLATWMLDHYQTIMDSTFIPAWENDGFPVHFYPQGFGRNGGLAIWHDEDADSIIFNSYVYRIPSPAEFRMQCNLALMMQARGILPYSIRSYSNLDGNDNIGSHDTGLLDEDLIPLDAPFEEWVYRERPSGDFCYAPPDSIPPWTDIDGNDYDPLYDLPDRPDTSSSGERSVEDILLWKFKPYGRLWDSMRGTMGEIGTVAPELTSLWWWEGYEDVAETSAPDSGSYDPFVQPEIRVFKLDGSNHVYLFYVNRQCRQDSTRVHVSIDDRDIPSSLITRYGLDHSRRFIIPVDNIRNEFYFDDTLEAGQGRLVEFVNALTLDPDIRVTDPDVVAFYAGTSKKTRDFEFVAGDDIDIQVEFYNMSTDSIEDVIVTCTDLTEDVEIDRDTLDFEGLSTSGWVSDFDTGRFTWETDSTDVGVHILEMYASPVVGEPDTLDNVATAVFLIRPRDYATFVLDDPWDMTEDKVSPPLWHTSDIDSLIGWNMDSTLTDSISGMFEGIITDPSDTNRVYLDVNSIKPIEPDRFNMLSLAGLAMERSLSVYLGWKDEDSLVYVIDTGLDLTTEWLESDPVSIGSLSSDWDTLEVEEIWLEFRGTNIDTSVRLGWVELTE